MLIKKIFEHPGLSVDFRFSPDEYSYIRNAIETQWIDNIRRHYPGLADQFNELGIANYHKLAHLVDHQRLWAKKVRVLAQEIVDQIKRFEFFRTLREELNVVSIADVVLEDGKVSKGHEEIYWRLVRPGVASDVGALHTDNWFHDILGQRGNSFSADVVTIKMWAPIICEPGKNGLIAVPDSHRRRWRVRYTEKNGNLKPELAEDLEEYKQLLLETEPGNFVLFNENLLHRGAVNKGNTTRVSVEITLLVSKDRHNIAFWDRANVGGGGEPGG